MTPATSPYTQCNACRERQQCPACAAYDRQVARRRSAKATVPAQAAANMEDGR